MPKSRSRSAEALEVRLDQLAASLYLMDQRLLVSNSRRSTDREASVDFAVRPVVFSPFDDGSAKLAVAGQLAVVNGTGSRFRVLVTCVYASDIPVEQVPLEQDVLDAFAVSLGGLQAYDFAQRQIRLLAAMHERDAGLPAAQEVEPRLLPPRAEEDGRTPGRGGS